MCENDEFVGRVLSRREALTMLGPAGAMFLIGCSTGDDDSDEPTATATTPATAAGSTSTDRPDPTATDDEATATSESAAATPTAATEPADEPTATADEAASVETMEVIPACVVSPELTEGPYFVDENLNRADIRSDPSDGTVKEGTPLDLALRVLRVNGDGCAPVEGAQVDVWQCDALGVYSDVQDPGFSTVGQQFLRGYQLTDDGGVAHLLTIYPGWYQGRTVHIHLNVRSGDGSGQSYEFTSQFFFDDELSDQVFENEPYASKGARGTRNDNDGIYRQSEDQLLLQVEPTDDGYAASFDIGLMIA